MKVVISIALVVLSASALLGQDSTSAHLAKKRSAPWFVERIKVSAGYFLPINNTDIRVGVKGGAAGTDIDFEKDLGFNQTSSTFLGSVQWRTTRRSRLSLTNYRIRRESTHTLEKNIEFEDQTYPVNGSINAFFNTNIVQFSYGYAIFVKEKFEAGVAIGTHIVGADAGISLNGAGGTVTGAKDFGFTAPLPDVGIWGGWALSDRWALSGEVNYLALTFNDISGSILTYQASVTYKAMKNFDLSLGYTGLNFKVGVEKTNYDAHFKWSYNGPSLTATYSFGKKYWVH